MRMGIGGKRMSRISTKKPKTGPPDTKIISEEQRVSSCRLTSTVSKEGTKGCMQTSYAD